MSARHLNVEQIQQLLIRPKRTGVWSGWEHRSNHAGHMIGTAALLEQDGTTIPGITLQVEIKAPVVAVSCLYLFSIMQLAGRERRRLYQLEVSPSIRRSHMGIAPIYGPHEHVGDTEASPVTDPNVHCDQWDGSVAWFFLRTSITPFHLPHPTTP